MPSGTIMPNFKLHMWTSCEAEQRVLANPESVHAQSLPYLVFDWLMTV